MNNSDTLINRKPAVAGQFYPSDREELQKQLKSFFSKTSSHPAGGEVMAIISPHAGYVFSGGVAAEAFSRIDPGKKYKTIFIIGSSHRNAFAGASVYSIGNYITPLGTVETDLETARKLVSDNTFLAFDPQYHRGEHSIEVQLPFLQYRLKNDFKIVPILLGTQDAETCKKLAKVLQPCFTADNLFVISTDFSHYPAYADAVKSDKLVADAIVSNDAEQFLNTIANCNEKKVPQLATGCCSWPAVLTLMYLTENNPDVVYTQLKYQNSGDSGYGEKDRVVGYFALSLSQKEKNDGLLNDSEKQEILQIARKTIGTYLAEKRIPEIDSKALPASLCRKSGAFVTLKKQGELRGCIGQFDAEYPLYKIVQKMAIASATNDYRFPAVTLPELEMLDIEISVLTPMRKITNVNSIRLGTDGIYIRKGGRSGTFLPQVATDTGWNLEEFLGHCARDKAGIGWEGWKDKDAEIFIYQAIVFGEKE